MTTQRDRTWTREELKRTANTPIRDYAPPASTWKQNPVVSLEIHKAHLRSVQCAAVRFVVYMFIAGLALGYVLFAP